MAPDELSWFIDNDVAKAVLSVEGCLEDRAGRRRRSRNPHAPRSRSADGARHHRHRRSRSSSRARTSTSRAGARRSVPREQTIRTIGSATDVEALAAYAPRSADGRNVRAGRSRHRRKLVGRAAPACAPRRQGGHRLQRLSHCSARARCRSRKTCGRRSPPSRPRIPRSRSARSPRRRPGCSKAMTPRIEALLLGAIAGGRRRLGCSCATCARRSSRAWRCRCR